MTKYVHTNIISREWKRLAEFYINLFDCLVKPPQRKLYATDQDGNIVELQTWQ